MLLGPGVKAAAIEKKISGNKLGYIAMVYAISKPFSTFCDGCTKTTFPSFSIAPRIKTSETIPAIFFWENYKPLSLAFLLNFLHYNNE